MLHLVEHRSGRAMGRGRFGAWQKDVDRRAADAAATTPVAAVDEVALAAAKVVHLVDRVRAKAGQVDLVAIQVQVHPDATIDRGRPRETASQPAGDARTMIAAAGVARGPNATTLIVVAPPIVNVAMVVSGAMIQPSAPLISRFMTVRRSPMMLRRKISTNTRCVRCMVLPTSWLIGLLAIS